jgi:hypothetical protein
VPALYHPAVMAAMARARSSHGARAVRDGLAVAGLLFGAYLFAVVAPKAGTFAFDAFAYWHYSLQDPYALPEGYLGSFVYSPVVARLFAPFSAMSWQAFAVLWLGVLVASAIWLGGWHGRGWQRFGWLYVLAFPPVAVELYHGNIQLLIAVAIALGFRYPAAWAFVLVTKVTPGVGLLWFAARREWRPLAVALGVAAVMTVASLALDGGLWPRWIERELLVSLATAPDQPQIPIPLWLRLMLAAALIVWGARTDRRWVVPVGAALALPVLWFAGLSILTAIPAVYRPELRVADEPARAQAARSGHPVEAVP